MSGKKSGKSIGKRGSKFLHHQSRRHAKDRIIKTALRTSAIRRMALMGGVTKMSARVVGKMTGPINQYIDTVMKHARTLAKFSKRKTITQTDVLKAVEFAGGRSMYGFGN